MATPVLKDSIGKRQKMTTCQW